MELTTWLLSFTVGLLLLLMVLLFLGFRLIAKNLTETINRERQNHQNALESLNLHTLELVKSQKPTELLSLISKQATLLSVKDPISFQQVQLMDSNSTTTEPVKPADNSEAGELQQWIEGNSELTEQEKEIYRELDPNLL